MKKNRAMRLAALMLVLVMMTSCFVGGTFAKYTTSIGGVAEARVAYWGFTQDGEFTFDLFESNDSGILNNGSGLLAPGSSGEVKVKFAYAENDDVAVAPEVDYTFNVTFTATDAKGNLADTDALDNNPNFVWKLYTRKTGLVVYNTFAELQKAIEDLDGNKPDDRYKAGTLPEAFYDTGSGTDGAVEYTIGWMWHFEEAGLNITADQTAAQDAIDTAMGNAPDLDDLKITFKITATQCND